MNVGSWMYQNWCNNKHSLIHRYSEMRLSNYIKCYLFQMRIGVVRINAYCPVFNNQSSTDQDMSLLSPEESLVARRNPPFRLFTTVTGNLTKKTWIRTRTSGRQCRDFRCVHAKSLSYWRDSGVHRQIEWRYWFEQCMYKGGNAMKKHSC